MNSQEKRFSKIEYWKAVLITGFFTGLLSFLAYFSINVFTNSSFSVLYFIVYFFPFLTMLLTAINFRKYYAINGMNFFDTFFLSLLIGLLSAFIMSLFIYLVYNFLNTEAFTHRMNALIASVLSYPNNQIEDAITLRELLHKMYSPFKLASWMFGANLLLSFLYACIIAIFVRKKKTFNL